MRAASACRAAPVRVLGVEILGRYGTALRMLVEREDGAFETVEPRRAISEPHENVLRCEPTCREDA
jgi:hypothetical protein